MAITLYLRSTATHVGSLGSHGNTDLETTTGTTATQSLGANTPRTYVYYSAAAFPGLLDWQTGDYTYNIDISTANANVQLTSLKVSRYDSSLSTEKASGTATANLTLSTTGLKTGTITFASPNPGNRASDDRLVLTITISKLAGGGTQSAVADLNGASDSRLDTPLTLPIIRDITEGSVSVSEDLTRIVNYVIPISEDSVSVSESLDDTENYIKPISESAVSVSASVSGTKIPGEPPGDDPGNKTYSVHFVEFPEEVSDSLYVPPPVQLTQVTQTQTHPYNIIQKVTTTKTHKYNAIAPVSRIRTHVFSVLEQILQTQTHKFNLLQQIVRTRTHKFSIIAKITVAKTHVFSVISPISRTRTHKFNIVNAIQVTKTHKFNVSSSIIQVTTTKTHKFNISSAATQVTQTQTHLYNVIGKIVKTKTHVFSVIQRVTTTKTHKFSVLQRALTTKTHVFSVIARVLTQKTHSFNSIARVQRTRTHKYNVAGRIFSTKTHKFNIIAKITKTRTHKFHILLAITPTNRQHRYAILQLVSRTRTHKYNTIGRISKTKTHRFQMGGRVILSKRHRFTVGFGGLLQELGGSTNAYVRFQDRVRIIDIFADLNNTALANVEIPVARPPANIAIAVVGIYEYNSRLLVANVHKPRHRIASKQIVPPIIDTIDNLAVAPYIGIEVLQPTPDSRLQTRSHILLHQKSSRIHLASLTQLSQNDKTKIRIASATMLQQTQETVIGSEALLEIPAFARPVVAPEIMSKQKAKVLKTLINLLSSDHLFQ